MLRWVNIELGHHTKVRKCFKFCANFVLIKNAKHKMGSELIV